MRDMQTAYVNLTDTELADKKREVFANVAPAIKGMWNMAQSPPWVRASRRIVRIQGLVGDSAVAVGGGGHQRNEGQRADGVGRTGVPVDDQSHAGDKNTGRPGRGGKDINAPDAGGRDNVAGHRAGDIGNGERNDSAVRLDKSENAEAGPSPTRFSSLTLPRRSRWRAWAAADLTETAFSTSASGR